MLEKSRNPTTGLPLPIHSLITLQSLSSQPFSLYPRGASLSTLAAGAPRREGYRFCLSFTASQLRSLRSFEASISTLVVCSPVRHLLSPPRRRCFSSSAPSLWPRYGSLPFDLPLPGFHCSFANQICLWLPMLASRRCLPVAAAR